MNNDFSLSDVKKAKDLGAGALIGLQKEDGHFVFELEADATIPAEYILLDHFLDTINQPLHDRMVLYLRSIQGTHGGWALFHNGELNISASVKAYFAMKCAGEDINAPHMVKAREAILAKGGAEQSNVFTRIQMALFGAVPWTAVPVMPVEIMLQPKWSPFHISKVAYWSRTVIVPLLILAAKKPIAKNPRKVRIDELFITHPDKIKKWTINGASSIFVPVFGVLDKILRFLEPHMPKNARQKSIQKAADWIKPRLNGEDGLGAIYPAMANALMAFDCLGYAKDNPDYVIVRKSIDKLVLDNKTIRTKDGKEQVVAYCQPCLSPVWDTCLSVHCLLEAGADSDKIYKACDWLKQRQIRDVYGDWALGKPGVKPGGWAFQYNNDYYPDVDDTAVVIMGLDRLDKGLYKDAIESGAEWVLGIQSKNGGWGAFENDNEYYYLNYIPFADHGALLDPPTADVTARCLSMLAQLGYKKDNPQIEAAVSYLRKEQEADGSWFGRWGTNYIYGTWAVLCALNAAGIDSKDSMVRKAVEWLKSKQRQDGGWGEDCASYWKNKKQSLGSKWEMTRGECAVSNPSQTAWAVIALMAAGEVDSDSVKRGISWLLSNQNKDGTWDEEYFTAIGFPRVFYLRYHGYRLFFSTWALARYETLKSGGVNKVVWGM
ncbi:MAG: squalene--hopene cyclase [Alphaproteobacteria bacterium]|nr:squalene--hopene cyclase [Alphaproteobacteria bacterium]